jgi:hypothetical protein
MPTEMLIRRTSTLLLLNLRSCRCQRTAFAGGILPFPGRAACLRFSTTQRTNKEQRTKDPKAIKAELPQPSTNAKVPAAASSEATNKNALLSEAMVSNAEQRKADWAIMKEMTQYLWPKAFLPVDLHFLV